ncbi:MAG: 4-hydroxybenzoate octaprenyltransferase [Rhodospirillales bacterium]|nr:4-hydroxybenzoate octaprenyltransferase [Rhodospirillales bacterium]MCB9996196.1 4-hydroxybenzoate octaprenyltransferase [Rhodospirillales bacterium]
MTKTKNHTDIKRDGWIDRILPAGVRPYAYLMRLDRPIGIWLLLLPSWWGIVLAAGGGTGINGFVLSHLLLFGAGAVIMRGAGCVINDLWDRDLDKAVTRTKGRPLAAGTVQPWQALMFLAVLLALGLWILLQMSLVTVLLGILAVPLIAVYPLMKRWTWWPQAFLGITFNFGALMGWSAINHTLGLAALALYAAGFFWTLGYDTVYAHQDKEDDMMAGIKSTALAFGEQSKAYVSGFYGMTMILLLAGFMLAGAGLLSILVLLLAGAHLIWQMQRWQMNDPENTLAMFRSNRAFGLLVVLAALL